MSKNTKVQKILEKSNYNFDDLCLIMEILRGEGGCPWDAEQTHQSIRKNFIEETYEVIEAIDNNDSNLLKEELGDVMLQVVFHTQMENELGNFNIDDVANDICKKLIHRHPHIFGDVTAKTADEVLSNWEAIKNVEKSRETTYDKLSSVPPMMPSLMRAAKVTKKSGEYKNSNCREIVDEAQKLLNTMSEHPEEINEQEVGELLLTLSALTSKLDIDAEKALYIKTNSFIEKYKQ